jgi:hydroxypyruvate isomerase
MNRRTFARNVAGSLLSASALAAKTSFATDNNSAGNGPANSPLKLSVMLWTILRDQPFEKRLEIVAEAGYRNVELVGEYSKWTDADFTRANAKRKELGITFDCTAGIKHSLCNPADRDGLLAELRDTLPVMERLEIPAMILLTGNVVPGMSVEQQHQSCVDGLKAASHIFEGKSIKGEPMRLLLENIDPEENPKYFLTSVARGFEIVKAVDHPQVQFLYDFFHEQISEGNLIKKLAENIKYVGLVHIADVPGRHEPGTGEINYGSIFRKLIELKYDRIVAMEFIPTGDPVTSLRAAAELVARSGSK